ncbi:MAG TPA: hypothetical protein VGN83_06355 [Falsiroseomonas sp.]|nr:hypothetical protein [Falsiroseomonas sp.]
MRQAAALMAGAAERAGRLAVRMLRFARRGKGEEDAASARPFDAAAALGELAELLT